jgi:hypothetical protein
MPVAMTETLQPCWLEMSISGFSFPKSARVPVMKAM